MRLQIISGDLKGAHEQLAIFNELQLTMGQSAECCFLNGLLIWKRSFDFEQTIGYFQKAIRVLMRDASMGPSPELFVKFDPTFILELANQYISCCTSGCTGILTVIQNQVCFKSRCPTCKNY